MLAVVGEKTNAMLDWEGMLDYFIYFLKKDALE
jgi:hypothetical protein